MNVQQFCVEQRALLRQFEAWWIRNLAENPETFPLDMKPGEWDANFAAFLELDRDEVETNEHPTK
jgi:hypothetical protein